MLTVSYHMYLLDLDLPRSWVNLGRISLSFCFFLISLSLLFFSFSLSLILKDMGRKIRLSNQNNLGVNEACGSCDCDKRTLLMIFL